MHDGVQPAEARPGRRHGARGALRRRHVGLDRHRPGAGEFARQIAQRAAITAAGEDQAGAAAGRQMPRDDPAETAAGAGHQHYRVLRQRIGGSTLRLSPDPAEPPACDDPDIIRPVATKLGAQGRGEVAPSPDAAPDADGAEPELGRLVPERRGNAFERRRLRAGPAVVHRRPQHRQRHPRQRPHPPRQQRQHIGRGARRRAGRQAAQVDQRRRPRVEPGQARRPAGAVLRRADDPALEAVRHLLSLPHHHGDLARCADGSGRRQHPPGGLERQQAAVRRDGRPADQGDRQSLEPGQHAACRVGQRDVQDRPIRVAARALGDHGELDIPRIAGQPGARQPGRDHRDGGSGEPVQGQPDRRLDGAVEDRGMPAEAVLPRPAQPGHHPAVSDREAVDAPERRTVVEADRGQQRVHGVGGHRPAGRLDVERPGCRDGSTAQQGARGRPAIGVEQHGGPASGTVRLHGHHRLGRPVDRNRAQKPDLRELQPVRPQGEPASLQERQQDGGRRQDRPAGVAMVGEAGPTGRPGQPEAQAVGVRQVLGDQRVQHRGRRRWRAHRRLREGTAVERRTGQVNAAALGRRKQRRQRRVAAGQEVGDRPVGLRDRHRRESGKAGGHGSKRLDQFLAAFDAQRQAMFAMGPADRQGEGDPRQRAGARGDGVGQLGRPPPQLFRAARRQQDPARPRREARLWPVRGLRQHRVGVGAAEAKGADGGDAGPSVRRAPWLGTHRHPEAPGGEVQLGVGVLEMQARRDDAEPHRQGRLDEAGDTGGGQGVADVTLDRADRRGPPGRAVGAGQRIHLDRVAEAGAGAMRLDQADRRRVQAVPRHHPADQRGLRRPARRGDAAGAAVLVDPGALEHRDHRITVGQGAVEALEHHHPHALAGHEAVGAGVEGAAAAGRRGHAAVGQEGVQARPAHQDRDPAGQRHVEVAVHHRPCSQVDRHQRGRAGGVDRQRRPLQVEQIGQPRRQDGVGIAERRAGVGAVAAVTVGSHPDEQPDGAPLQLLPAVSGILQRLPRPFQEHPLLRAHGGGLGRGQPEGIGVEQVMVVEEAAPATDAPAGAAPVV